MMVATVTHEFVEYVPRDLVDGVIYVSVPHSTVVHLCACGCGNKVVTPISPADWQLTFDGDSISLHPSVGNWGFPCRSHYWIRQNQVRWSGMWSDEKAARGRARDDLGRKEYFAQRANTTSARVPSDADNVGRRSRRLHLPRWLRRDHGR